MNLRPYRKQCVRLLLAVTAGAASLAPRPGIPRHEKNDTAEVSVHTARASCVVFLDNIPAGKTDRKGELLIQNVDPTDHYIHVDCPGDPENAFLVSPQAGDTAEIDAAPGGHKTPPASPLEAAEARIELQRLIEEAIRLRTQGHLEEAVAFLRDAAKLDPENSDLHRELGITFLLGKEWKRARIEMLEALRHDPNDADAHNGLGYALEKLDDVDAALKEYRTATRLEPDDHTYREHFFEALAKYSARHAEKNEKKK